MISFLLIKTPEQLMQLVDEIKKRKVIGIDLECENNLHHFGVYTALIQISTRDQNYVVDALELSDIQPLLDVLEDKTIQKVFHDIGFDFRILQHQFNCKPQNIFDTQLAAQFLGKGQVGLGSLLVEYFAVEKQRKFQRVDWTKRPLSMQMLNYAVKDTAFLIPLKEKLEQKLTELGRIEWIYEEFSNIEKQDWPLSEQSHLDLSGAKALSPNQLAVLHALFEERKELAKELDLPVFKVFRNQQLLSFAKNPPYNADSWRTLKGVHPKVKQQAQHFFNVTKAAMQGEGEECPHLKKQRLTFEQKEKLEMLTTRRDQVAEQLNLPKYIVCSNQDLKDAVVHGAQKVLRNWQRALLKV